jgi:hypothetical protein
MTTDADLSFPVGRFTAVMPATTQVRAAGLDDIATLPALLRAAVNGLTAAQLDTPYRPGGWTVRQVVHHVADSHVNAYVRFKLALAEESPTIKPYDQDVWAGMPDSRMPPDVSLAIVDGVHGRWAELIRGLTEAQFARTFVHPELGEAQSLDRQVQLYAWPGRHHVAHVAALRQRQGW